MKSTLADMLCCKVSLVVQSSVLLLTCVAGWTIRTLTCYLGAFSSCHITVCCVVQPAQWAPPAQDAPAAGLPVLPAGSPERAV